MKKQENIRDVIKELNAYHEEKERRYFERNLLKQKLGKIIFILIIILTILGYVLYFLLSKGKQTENIQSFNNFLENFIYFI